MRDGTKLCPVVYISGPITKGCRIATTDHKGE